MLLACKLVRRLRVSVVGPENITIIQAAPAVNTLFNRTLIGYIPRHEASRYIFSTIEGGVRVCGIGLFLVRFCGNFYFKVRYCGFQSPSGMR